MSSPSIDQIVPQLYEELRALAQRQLRGERAGHTLQPTALVHEAYLRLAEQHSLPTGERGRILALAAQMMRRILINHAEARRAAKRGGDAPRLSLDEVGEVGAERPFDVIALHEALRKLEAIDPRQAQIVELRYFAGASVEDTARALDISPATVHREWATARMWLYDVMRGARARA